MANFEKQLAEEILQATGLSASKLGLRFDRVVVRVLGDLRSFAERAAPADVAVLVTISAPIRLPAKTVGVLETKIGALLSAGALRDDQRLEVHGNSVRLRLARRPTGRGPRLIGFVHNPGVGAAQLLDLAERWLGAGA